MRTTKHQQRLENSYILTIYRYIKYIQYIYISTTYYYFTYLYRSYTHAERTKLFVVKLRKDIEKDRKIEKERARDRQRERDSERRRLEVNIHI